MSRDLTSGPALVKAAVSLSALKGVGRAALKRGKGAASSAGQRALSAGGLGSVGALGGAGLGGLAGAAQGYRQDGWRGGLKGGLTGAAGGAALGGTVGALGGALGGGKAQALTRRLSGKDKGVVGKFSRFGERQVHGLTGVLPANMSKAEGLRAIKASPRANVEQMLATATKPKDISSYQKALGTSKALEEAGVTNVPGFFKAMAKNPTGTAKNMVAHEWHTNPGLVGKAMSFGMPAAYVGGQALKAPAEGESRVGNTLGSLAESAAYMAPMGFLGSTALGALAGKGGRGVGGFFGGKKKVKKDLGQNSSPPAVEEAAESAPVEHEYSDRATGDIQL